MQSEIEKYVPVKKKVNRAGAETAINHQSKSIEIRSVEVEKIIDKIDDSFGIVNQDINQPLIFASAGNVVEDTSNSENDDSEAVSEAVPESVPKATALEKSGDGYAIRSSQDFEQLGDQESSILPIKGDLQLLFTLAQGVFQQLGPGHTENIYHKALELELRLYGLIYESEKRVLITYQSPQKPGNLFTLGEERIDLFLVEPQLIIELKATSTEPRQPELAQIIKYYRELVKVASPEEEDKLATMGVIINFPQPGPNKKARQEIDFALIHLAE